MPSRPTRASESSGVIASLRLFHAQGKPLFLRFLQELKHALHLSHPLACNIPAFMRGNVSGAVRRKVLGNLHCNSAGCTAMAQLPEVSFDAELMSEKCPLVP
jgi:hypothetical protein